MKGFPQLCPSQDRVVNRLRAALEHDSLFELWTRRLRSADAIRQNRQTYEEAEERTRKERPSRPTWFSPSTNFRRITNGK